MDRIIILLIGLLGLAGLGFFLISSGESQVAEMDGAAHDLVSSQMEVLVGRWESEERTANDGRTFTFEYIFEPFSQNSEMFEMVITQHFDDGQSLLLWRGYKGWDPAAQAHYYYGFSPSGRLGRGTVYIDSAGDLVTEYEGISATGDPVKIRDVFVWSGSDAFTAVTYILQDGQWQQVWEDHWTRLA